MMLVAERNLELGDLFWSYLSLVYGITKMFKYDCYVA